MHLFICWGLFVINNGLLVDSVKPQVLWCIIYRSEQVSYDALVHLTCACLYVGDFLLSTMVC
jgi:hypothetical protein